MMDLTEVVYVHEALNSCFWGASGVRDERALVATLARPEATFDLHYLYPTVEEKAAALVESMVKNHPFATDVKS